MLLQRINDNVKSDRGKQRESGLMSEGGRTQDRSTHLIERKCLGRGIQAGGGFQPLVDGCPHYGTVGGAGAGPDSLSMEAHQLHLNVDKTRTMRMIRSNDIMRSLSVPVLVQTAKAVPKNTARLIRTATRQAGAITKSVFEQLLCSMKFMKRTSPRRNSTHTTHGRQ